MAKRIVIAGAGGFGRGVHAWLTTSPRHLSASRIDDVVFIDDNPQDAGCPAPRIGSIADYRPQPNDEVVCAMGVPAIRRAVVDRLRALGARFHTFVDDRAVIAPTVTIGDGAVICPGVVISADAVVGEQVHINFNCSVGHDTVLGSFTTLSPSVNIMGQVQVGESVFFGGSAVVLPRIAVAAGTVLGAGAVVVRTVETSATLVGSPARPLQGSA